MQTKARLLLELPFPEERVFRYQAMQDILHHLVNNPTEWFTQKELAGMTGADISSVSRAVDLIEKLGVLEIKEGVPTRIRISQDHLEREDPLFSVPQEEFRAPLQAFLDELESEIGEADEIAELLGVVLFGSVARGTADRSSDIDLLLVVDGDLTLARRLGTKTARELEDRKFEGERYEFEVLVETPDSALSHGDQLRELFRDGIVLKRTDGLKQVRDGLFFEEQEHEEEGS
ncbi:nucleotidyltransferase domain-containing protein [Halorubellus litoreus]|uniref:Nucleotidyltransferase domain-containing protein n=1 Tax=Halorubellus litoreus TaxID=755308 RepID=A0ABD5VIB6_9EURY